MTRKFEVLLAQLVPLLIQFCAEIEDDPQWSKEDDDDFTDEDLNSTVGEQTLDRLSCALGGNVMLPEAFKYLGPLLQDTANWQGTYLLAPCVDAVGGWQGQVTGV